MSASKWVQITTAAIVFAAAAAAASLFSVVASRRRCRRLGSRVSELEASLDASLEKAAAERRGRVKAQQALRETLVRQGSDGTSMSSFPMAPIGTVHSCFSTRNGTPRQPLLVPLSRARIVFNQSRVPPEALEGLSDYSHCWVIYVFHLNTDLDKLWKQPTKSKLKAKVRVPRLKGGKMGVLATRSPHRPCPIGLSVAKVEAVHGNTILLSGVDLVDGTPILDIKPYLPYSDCIQGAIIPDWVKVDNNLSVASVSFSANFASSLDSCWITTDKHSLYASAYEFKSLIKEVLSWDIRSLSQRSRPHQVFLAGESHRVMESSMELDYDDYQSSQDNNGSVSSSSLNELITYHLILEGIKISYKIDGECNVIVEKANLVSELTYNGEKQHN